MGGGFDWGSTAGFSGGAEVPRTICGHKSKAKPGSMVVDFSLATFCFSGTGMEQEERRV